MLSRLYKLPDYYKGSENEGTAKSALFLTTLLPIPVAIILVERFFYRDYVISVVLAISILVIFVAKRLVISKKLFTGVLILVIYFSITICLACALGSGIKDTAIISLPLIMGLSSFTLRRKELFLVSFITLAGLVVIVYAQSIGIIPRKPISSGNIGDFIVILSIIFLGIIIAFSMMNNLAESLEKANEEVEIGLNSSKLLGQRLDEKSELIHLVHNHVISSLSYVSDLVKGSGLSPAALKNIDQKIKVMVAVHQVMDTTGAFERVELKEYLFFLTQHKVVDGLKSLWVDEDIFLSVDESIYYGNAFVAMCSLAMGDVSVDISQENRLLVSNFSSKNIIDDLDCWILDLMILQLKADLKTLQRGEMVIQQLTFKPIYMNG